MDAYIYNNIILTIKVGLAVCSLYCSCLYYTYNNNNIIIHTQMLTYIILWLAV